MNSKQASDMNAYMNDYESLVYNTLEKYKKEDENTDEVDKASEILDIEL